MAAVAVRAVAVLAVLVTVRTVLVTVGTVLVTVATVLAILVAVCAVAATAATSLAGRCRILLLGRGRCVHLFYLSIDFFNALTHQSRFICQRIAP